MSEQPTARPTPVRRGSSAPSIGDVARRAGVSQQTVSRVANGSDAVRPATRDKVQLAMTELGYTPNRAARALRSGSFTTIGLIAHRLSRTGESRTVEAVVAAARAEGYTVNLVDLEQATTSEVTAAAVRLEHQAIDGLVIIRAEDATPETLALAPGFPVVVADSRFVGHLPSVGIDQAAGSTLVVDHLLDLGHRTVHHVRGPLDSGPGNQRADAWREALLARGAPVPEPVVGDWTMASGYAAGRAIIAADATAVYCANDEMAGGLLRAVHEAGLRVPQDLSVAGFDDIPMAEYLWPPLTTVHQNFAETGRTLVALLMRQIRDHEALEPRAHLIPATLVVRASTGAPPAAPRE